MKTAPFFMRFYGQDSEHRASEMRKAMKDYDIARTTVLPITVSMNAFNPGGSEMRVYFRTDAERRRFMLNQRLKDLYLSLSASKDLPKPTEVTLRKLGEPAFGAALPKPRPIKESKSHK